MPRFIRKRVFGGRLSGSYGLLFFENIVASCPGHVFSLWSVKYMGGDGQGRVCIIFILICICVPVSIYIRMYGEACLTVPGVYKPGEGCGGLRRGGCKKIVPPDLECEQPSS